MANVTEGVVPLFAVGNTHETRRQSSLAGGLLFWGLFSVVAVAVRGVRWDENHEFAQAILGLIHYDPGHPMYVYTRGLYSIQTWALAGLMAVRDSALLVNGLRNVLFLVATTFPVFLWATLLSRRALTGHVAVIVVLMGIHVSFYGNYPQFVWPGFYSNGHVGTGWALASAALLASPYWRLGLLFTGLMPMVHLGQFPPVFLLAVCRVAYSSWWRKERTAALRAFPGLLLCAVFWLALRDFAVPVATHGPYASEITPDAVLAGYMTHFASHRALPWGTGHLLLAGGLILFAAAARREWRVEHGAGPFGWLFLHTLIVTGIVWGTMAVQRTLGSATPYLLLAWMPYRLMNHLGPLLVAAMVAMPGRRSMMAQGFPALAVVLLLGALRPVLGMVVPQVLFARYLADGAWAVFLLWGASVALLAMELRGDRRFVRPWLLCLAIALVALAVYHQFGAGCVLIGMALSALGGCLSPSTAKQHGGWGQPPSRGRAVATGGLAVLLALVLLVGQWQHREHLPVSPFEREVRDYLAARGDPDALIVARYQQEGLQARLGHPVMTDMASLTWIPYRPSLGPAFYGMYRDLYGLDLAPPPGVNPMPLAWFEVWPRKNGTAWRRLARKYDFHYVLAPSFMKLALTPVVEGDHERLYAVEMEDMAE